VGGGALGLKDSFLRCRTAKATNSAVSSVGGSSPAIVMGEPKAGFTSSPSASEKIRTAPRMNITGVSGTAQLRPRNCPTATNRTLA
jgi:hypothetical protein